MSPNISSDYTTAVNYATQLKSDISLGSIQKVEADNTAAEVGVYGTYKELKSMFSGIKSSINRDANGLTETAASLEQTDSSIAKLFK